MSGFRYAIAAGADFIEMDVAITRDDVPVISHDPVLPAGHTIRKLTRDDLRQLAPHVPALDEGLSLGRVQFNMEMKRFPERPEFTPAPDRRAEFLLVGVRAPG